MSLKKLKFVRDSAKAKGNCDVKKKIFLKSLNSMTTAHLFN